MISSLLPLPIDAPSHSDAPGRRSRAERHARRLRWLPALLVAAALSACGGGGSGSATSSSGSTSDSSTSDSGTTTTVTAPSITTAPQSASVSVGDSVVFSVTASGSTPLSYQWRKDGTAISGATASSLSLASVATTDAGSYDVTVANSAGSVTSAAATLTVGDAGAAVIVPTITSQPTAVAATVGASVSFAVAASGSAPLSYQWRKDGTAISGATSAGYTLASVALSDAGSYDVVISNPAGSVTSASAALTVAAATSGTLAAEVTTAAQAFAATLSSSQQATLQQSWSLASARRWSNLPAAMVARNGVAWSSLSTAQKTAARTLITTALGATGNQLHLGMQAADNALVASYSASTSSYGEGHYHIAFLGTPSASGFWMLQLTGHHLTWNIAFNGGYASATPMFLGIEPRAAFTVSGTTWDPMATQRSAMDALAAALPSYPAALLSGTYDDILFGANGSGGIDGTMPKSYPTGSSGRGVLYGALSAADQAKVQAVIRSYVLTTASEMSTALLTAYLSDTALAQTYVAYAGGGSLTTRGSYFRVDGPRVWIEWSVQNGVLVRSDIHPHTIWRDKSADYGGQF